MKDQQPKQIHETLERLAFEFLFRLQRELPPDWVWMFSDQSILVIDKEDRLLAQVERGEGESLHSLVIRLGYEVAKSGAQRRPRVAVPRTLFS